VARDRPTTEAVRQWAQAFARRGERLAGRSARSEPRARALDSVRGLRGDAARTNGWQRAAYPGAGRPGGVQHLRGRAAWDADAVRDDLRADAVVAVLGAQAAGGPRPKPRGRRRRRRCARGPCRKSGGCWWGWGETGSTHADQPETNFGSLFPHAAQPAPLWGCVRSMGQPSGGGHGMNRNSLQLSSSRQAFAMPFRAA
jgi:hypothetical protein